MRSARHDDLLAGACSGDFDITDRAGLVEIRRGQFSGL
jgi:hypothetical protein